MLHDNNRPSDTKPLENGNLTNGIVPSVGKKIFSLSPLALSGLFMLLGVLVLIWIGRDTGSLIGSKLSNLDLSPLVGRAETVTTDSLAGKVVVLHFWGTWCPPCREEYPAFAKLMEGYANKPNFRCVSISCEQGISSTREELQKETEQFLAKNQIQMPIYCDPAVFTRSHFASMMPRGGFAYPTTIVVDQKGVIRYAWRGMADMKKLDVQIRMLLSANTSKA